MKTNLSFRIADFFSTWVDTFIFHSGTDFTITVFPQPEIQYQSKQKNQPVSRLILNFIEKSDLNY